MCGREAIQFACQHHSSACWSIGWVFLALLEPSCSFWAGFSWARVKTGVFTVRIKISPFLLVTCPLLIESIIKPLILLCMVWWPCHSLTKSSAVSGFVVLQDLWLLQGCGTMPSDSAYVCIHSDEPCHNNSDVSLLRGGTVHQNLVYAIIVKRCQNLHKSTPAVSEGYP